MRVVKVDNAHDKPKQGMGHFQNFSTFILISSFKFGFYGLKDRFLQLDIYETLYIVIKLPTRKLLWDELI